MTDIDKVQKYLLATLDEFIRVCNKYNLEWFADGGTLLGAVRDSKMIPWDDDIDIVMPRNSYNKFITLSDEFKEPFFLQTVETDVNYFSSAVKLLNTSGYIDRAEERQFSYRKGFYIDIAPLDYVPNDEKQLDYLRGFVASTVRYCSQRFISYTEYNTFLSHDTSLSVFKATNALLTNVSTINQHSELLANTDCFFNSQWSHTLLNSEDYNKYILCTFEGLRNQLRIPQGYSRVLTLWYGSNYMKPCKICSGHDYFSNVNVYFQN